MDSDEGPLPDLPEKCDKPWRNRFSDDPDRVEDRRLLTSGGIYLCDLDLPGLASVVHVTSTTPDVDIKRAGGVDGCVGVYTTRRS